MRLPREISTRPLRRDDHYRNYSATFAKQVVTYESDRKPLEVQLRTGENLVAWIRIEDSNFPFRWLHLVIVQFY